MNQLQPFQFDEDAVRVVQDGGVAWFVARDVARVLGYANPAAAIEKHCKGVAKRYPLQTPGGTQDVRLIGEGDVLRLVIRSRLPSAERFERWVFDEVLPTIGRTGSYGAPAAPDLLSDPGALRALLLSYTERTMLLEQTVQQQAPKVAALDRIAAARGAVCITDAAKALQMRRGDLIQWMQEHGWIHKREGTNWKAYAPRIASGMLTHKVVVRGEQDERLYDQVLVTSRGLARLAELIAKERTPETEGC